MRGSHGDDRIVARARRLRAASTEAERRLWGQLRNRRLGGFKFNRQYPIGPYIVDFICRDQRLIVELDGSQHIQSAYDTVRDAALTHLGYQLLRVWNNEALSNTEGVLVTIQHLLTGGTPPPGLRYAPAHHPSPAGETEEKG